MPGVYAKKINRETGGICRPLYQKKSENSDTIEFRLFRGTLRYTTFIAVLQLVDEICRCAINMTDREFEEMTWNDFVSGIHDEELINYLKSKRLYANKTVR